ncbi:hypothetical protein L6Q79_06845 [bacterium]|nr:hypothetical protein [bacterium]NUN47037.1 hypothetical protein [bacterium]
MTNCEYEAKVLQSITDNRWSDEIHHHIRECENCRMIAEVTPRIKILRDETKNQAVVPFYRWIYIQAAIRLKEKKTAQLKFRSNIMLALTVLIACIGVTLLFEFNGYSPLNVSKQWGSSDVLFVLTGLGVWLLSQWPLHFIGEIENQK